MSDQLTQSNYKETKYEDQSWEIVGEPPGEERFLPLEVDVLGTENKPTDPMFADYGGVTPEGTKKRWHLPEGIAYESEEKKAEKQDLVEKRTIDEAELEQARAEAYELGIIEGRGGAVEENAARFEKLERSISTLIQDLRSSFEERLASLEVAALDLALELSKKLITHAVEINPEYLVPVIKEALEHVGNAQIKRIRVSAQDLEFIRVIGLEKQLREKDAVWSFEADESVRSGCIIDSSAGEVDFRIDQAWERIKEKVLRSVHE